MEDMETLEAEAICTQEEDSTGTVRGGMEAKANMTSSGIKTWNITFAPYAVLTVNNIHIAMYQFQNLVTLFGANMPQ